MQAATKFAALATLMAVAAPAALAQNITVEEMTVVDYRPVIARIEAGDVATARSRLQGVVSRLSIDEGQVVEAGELVALVTDDTIGPGLAAFDARIAGLQSQISQAEADLARNEALFDHGFFPRARLDEQRTALEVLNRNLASAQAERRALAARQSEGRILAPADARVTSVNVVEGSVVNPGEVIASFATLNGVVRLSLPERHASQVAEGETISLRQPSRGNEVHSATIITVYPELRDGAVVADATVQGGLNALVGERVDVLAPVGERRAIRIPAEYVSTRYGVDFVRVEVGERFVDAPVALAAPLGETEGYYEILSGLRPGDVITMPE
ncbi:MAG TPA: efflux transporter periplasmic adaptor subunit [Hyphomonadaceae bacterium]|nr:efflux transporter periplasmic adaptor subunit [Hyphomonadaceae bacterium]